MKDIKPKCGNNKKWETTIGILLIYGEEFVLNIQCQGLIYCKQEKQAWQTDTTVTLCCEATNTEINTINLAQRATDKV